MTTAFHSAWMEFSPETPPNQPAETAKSPLVSLGGCLSPCIQEISPPQVSTQPPPAPRHACHCGSVEFWYDPLEPSPSVHCWRCEPHSTFAAVAAGHDPGDVVTVISASIHPPPKTACALPSRNDETNAGRGMEPPPTTTERK